MCGCYAASSLSNIQVRFAGGSLFERISERVVKHTSSPGTTAVHNAYGEFSVALLAGSAGARAALFSPERDVCGPDIRPCGRGPLRELGVSGCRWRARRAGG